MDTSALDSIIGNAQKLMLSEEFNAKVEAHSGRAGAVPSVNMTDFERQAFGESSYGAAQPQYTAPRPEPIPQPNVPKSRKLPQAIVESFQKQPALTGVENDPSALGQISRKYALNEEQKNMLPMQTYGTHAGGGSVDYSIIKAIFNDCLNEKLDSLKKAILNESVGNDGYMLRGIKIGDGNKIQMLDTKGNLYEAVLKLKKRKM